MDFLWISAALVFGFVSKQIGLPPMVGFLAAGFGLFALGAEHTEGIQILSDFGVTLLLFTIGLKLNLRNLMAPEVWAAGSLHMLLITGIIMSLLLFLSYIELPWLAVLDVRSAALIAFSLSFSSTIYAVKVLEDRGELKTRHGQVAIGILIIQDIIAVVFMTLAVGKVPSIWAFGLLALPLLRPFIKPLFNRMGHGELLIIFGMFMAVAGYQLFELVGLKGGLGALVFGVLLGGYEKTSELAKTLLSFKDVLLVGFFLSIGISGLPTADNLIIACLLVIFFLPLKSLFYFILQILFRLRARTAYLSTNSLSNYSEFGLIVASLGVTSQWIDQTWLMTIALAMSFSFIAAALFNTQVHNFYAKYEKLFHRFELRKRLTRDLPVDIGDARILILGAGRVGNGAYDEMSRYYPGKVCAIDTDQYLIKKYQDMGKHMLIADGEDADFWSSVDLSKLGLMMFAMSSVIDIKQAVELAQSAGYQGKIVAVTKYSDDAVALEEVGVDATFNIYAEAGAGFAEHTYEQFKNECNMS